MRKSGLLVCAIAIVFSVSGQEAIFNAHWVKKEYQPYRLNYVDYTVENGDTVAVERLGLLVDVLVQDSLSKGYRLQWKLHDFEVETNHFMSRQWVTSLRKFELNYTTTLEGVIREMSDAEEFDKTLDRTIDIFFKNYKGETMLADRERLYLLRNNFENCILSMVQQFHQAHGMGYTSGEVVEVPSEVELSLTHKSIPAVIFKKLEKLDDGLATLVTATVLDTASVNNAVRNYLVPVLQADTLTTATLADGTAEAVFSVPTFQQENSGALMMHLPTGWPVFFYDCREVTYGKTTTGEYMEMELLR